MFKWTTSQKSTVRLIKVGITNCYLIETNKSTILIDSGQKKKVQQLETSLNALLDTNKKLNYLILTHTHYDHAENAKWIKEKFSPSLVVHKSESGFLKNGFTTLPKGTNRITNFISGMGNKFASWIGEYDAVLADIEVDELLTGKINGIEIISTPGHTVGSISIIVDQEIAIVGDSLFGAFKNTILPPFADHKKELFESWEKLLQTPCRIFLPAHGRAIKRTLFEKEFKKTIK